jgi:hypothetical protein
MKYPFLALSLALYLLSFGNLSLLACFFLKNSIYSDVDDRQTYIFLVLIGFLMSFFLYTII